MAKASYDEMDNQVGKKEKIMGMLAINGIDYEKAGELADRILALDKTEKECDDRRITKQICNAHFKGCDGKGTCSTGCQWYRVDSFCPNSFPGNIEPIKPSPKVEEDCECSWGTGINGICQYCKKPDRTGNAGTLAYGFAKTKPSPKVEVPEKIIPSPISGLQEPSIYLVINKFNELIDYLRAKGGEGEK